MQNKNIFAKDQLTGCIKNVSEVPNGNDCKCICIKCGGALQARHGDIRQHHFKHISAIECNSETILHLIAKRILKEDSRFHLPGSKGYFHYHEVTDEQWLRNQRPDIILIGKDKRVNVEIAVTCFIGEEKIEKIRASDYNTVEIDLSRLNRNCSYNELKKIIIEEVEHKKIIHWAKETQITPPITETDDKTLINWLIGICISLCLAYLANLIYKKRRAIF